MDYIALFLVVTTTQAVSLDHHCNSEMHSSASGMADSQHSITIQCCLIDNVNCTIIRIDTGQQLDIVYTTESLLVVTPTDGQTLMLIPKNDPELSCSISNNVSIVIHILGPILTLSIIVTSGYTAVVHLMFKELQNTFGKLIIIYNTAIAFEE